LRVLPTTSAQQRVDEFSIRLSPDTRLHRHNDYFGTEVVEFEIARPHRELVIDVQARVATQEPVSPPAPSWEMLAGDAYREAGGEYLFQTDFAFGHPVLAELVAETEGFSEPLALARAVMTLIPERFEYRKGATYVDSPLSVVLDGGAGVCQDFVHLGLYLLRHHGIAARYVSGYLFTTDDSEETADDVPAETRSVEVDTHAWIEVMLPSTGEGDEASHPVWVGIDPTNRNLTGSRHVKIGHGRQYSDVPPIKGVYRGIANSEIDASVTMTLFEGADAL